jgi:hypothetical protein
MYYYIPSVGSTTWVKEKGEAMDKRIFAMRTNWGDLQSENPQGP